MITIIGKICNTSQETGKESQFIASKYRFTPGNSDDLGLGSIPNLELERHGQPVRIPFAHPYSNEAIYAMSHGGRGILSSTNNLHKATRYYAFSTEKMMDGKAVFVPLTFGRDTVGPQEIHMDHLSGAVAWPKKDERSLVIQYFS